MTQRRIVLHAGLPKTGSSALQVAFVRNRDELESAGVHYPLAASDKDAERGRVTTGNAGAIRSFLYLPHVREIDEAAAQVDSALQHGSPTTLISSEILYFTRRERLPQLLDHVEERGASLEVAVYVRNIIPWVVSFHSQRIKRHRFVGTLGDFLDEFERELVRIRQRLELFVNVLGPDRVHVMHFESHRSDLVGTFLANAVGVRVEGNETPETINRALTAHEVEWMRVVNQSVEEDHDAWRISDALVQHPPLTLDPPVVTAQEADRIHRLADDQVGWVNETFFDGSAMVAVEDPSVRIGDRRAIAPTPAETRLIEVLADVATRRPEIEPLARQRERNAKLRERIAAEKERRVAARLRVRELEDVLRQEQATPPPLRSIVRSWARRVSRRARRRTPQD